MKARGTLAAAVASAGILLAGWQAGTQAGGVSTLTSSSGPTAAGATGTLGSGSSGAGSSGTGSSGSSGTTGSGGNTGSSGSASSGSSSSSDSSGGSSSSSGGSGSSGTSGTGSTSAGTYQGTAVQTRFGSVQVQITVASGKITEVTALQLTDDDRKSIQISNRAAPLLRAEVLSAQSADVQTISGATVTSNAYLTSLQAAIDAANL